MKRYKSEDNPPPKPEKVKLSPVAQAVLDAAINVAESPDAEAIAAAVLRAVADQVVPETKRPRNQLEYELGDWDARDDVRDKLLAIADELRNHQ